MMKHITFLLFFTFFYSLQVKSQSLKLSQYSQISIVTVGAGDALFEAFGHSAIRVEDPVLRMDTAYNYGMFDFNQPNFYTNFAKGRLLYSLGRYPFDLFVKSYQRNKRWIKVQVLNLNLDERQSLYQFLETNALPQNASYYYDPFFNNCSTKLRDIVKDIFKDRLEFSENSKPENLTLRKLMNKELPWNHWGSFGINTALGSKLDEDILLEEPMYLPNYVFSYFGTANILINGKKEPLIKSEKVVLSFDPKTSTSSWFNPLLIFSILSLLILYYTWKNHKTQNRSKWMDFIIFLSTGIIGSLLVFLWFFTDHKTTPNNFNALWAFAPNLLISFFLIKEKTRKWVKSYMRLYLILLLLIPFIWTFGIQGFSIVLIPFLIALLVRVFFLNRVLLTSKE